MIVQATGARWGRLLHGETEWTWHQPRPLERDEIFTRQAHAFLDGIEGKASPLATFDEAVQTLKFNLAALESSRRHMPIHIS